MALFDVGKQKVPSNLLHNRFGWNPFSILNTISWDWQRRRDEWEGVIQDSTKGRDVKRFNATPTNTFSSRGADAKKPESVSEFDPYLCELMYKWFSLEGMKVLDPFAGGCVRGEVASILGRHYTGIDLSQTQVLENVEHHRNLLNRFTDIKGSSRWICGDSASQLFGLRDMDYDFVFTCPPYYNLEKYSNNPADLSNLETYDLFLDRYSTILFQAAMKLKPDSFFVIVVSEIRANSNDVSKSYYLGLVPDTIKILTEKCFLHYYNEIILENAIGSLPMRAPKYFDKNRKIGRHHQNILVFYKGDITHIENKFGKVSV